MNNAKAGVWEQEHQVDEDVAVEHVFCGSLETEQNGTLTQG